MSLHSIDFYLNTPLKYASKNGTQEEAEKLILRAPTMANMRYAAKAKEMVMKSHKDAMSDPFFKEQIEESKNLSKEEKDKIRNSDEYSSGSGLEILFMMGADCADVLDNIKSIFVNGGCYVSDEVKITESLIKDISFSDFERMAGEYVSNFFLSSSAKKTPQIS